MLENLIEKLKNNKAANPDGISYVLIKAEGHKPKKTNVLANITDLEVRNNARRLEVRVDNINTEKRTS